MSTEKPRSTGETGPGMHGQRQCCVWQVESPTLFSIWMDAAMQQLVVCGQIVSRNVE